MRSTFGLIFLLSVVILFISGAAADASVSLSFTNSGATSTSVKAGSSFPVEVKLTSTSNAAADQVTAVDYYLQASTSNIFTIASRNTTTDGSAFGFTYSPDASVSLAGAGPAMNPRNSTDLGGSQTVITDPPVQNTTVVVADFTISVAANAPLTTYTITTFSLANTGYSDASNSNHTFASAGTYTVTVTASPEPGMAGLALFGGIAFLCRRGRRAA